MGNLYTENMNAMSDEERMREWNKHPNHYVARSEYDATALVYAAVYDELFALLQANNIRKDEVVIERVLHPGEYRISFLQQAT